VDRPQLIQMFQRMAAEVAERDMPELAEESVIADLGLDSLQTLEVIGQMEQELEINVPDDQLVGIETVSQLVDLVEKRMAS